MLPMSNALKIVVESALSLCANSSCPTVYDTTDPTVVAVQGYVVAESAVQPGADEGIVLVDRALLEQRFRGDARCSSGAGGDEVGLVENDRR